jgi:hypothetical protein
MKSLFFTVGLLMLTGAATAGPISSKFNLRVADAAADACLPVARARLIPANGPARSR